MNRIEYDYMTCDKLAAKYGMTLNQVLDELDEHLGDYANEFVLSWLATRRDIDLQPNIVNGTYISVWEGEGEITSKAKINLNTGKVEILESFDPADCYTEDGEPFECEFLKEEYVTVNGENYSCHHAENKDECWFYYDGTSLEKDYEEQER